jgi:NTE family protein
VTIDEVAYWDGGLVPNTPLQFVLDQDGADPLVILQVDLFNAAGAMPTNLIEADERERDIHYPSRTRMNQASEGQDGFAQIARSAAA